MNEKEAVKLREELVSIGYYAYAFHEIDGDGWTVQVSGKSGPYKEDLALAMERLAQLSES